MKDARASDSCRDRLLLSLHFHDTGCRSIPQSSAAERGTLSQSPHAPPGPAGSTCPSAGVLRVLVVFVSFPDDETPHPYWPAHQPPTRSWTVLSIPIRLPAPPMPFNLTNYFRQMSLGAFHVIGEAVWVETAHSQEEYRNSGSYGSCKYGGAPREGGPHRGFLPLRQLDPPR